jgi:hypothetical protein
LPIVIRAQLPLERRNQRRGGSAPLRWFLRLPPPPRGPNAGG